MQPGGGDEVIENKQSNDNSQDVLSKSAVEFKTDNK